MKAYLVRVSTEFEFVKTADSKEALKRELSYEDWNNYRDLDWQVDIDNFSSYYIAMIKKCKKFDKNVEAICKQFEMALDANLEYDDSEDNRAEVIAAFNKEVRDIFQLKFDV